MRIDAPPLVVAIGDVHGRADLLRRLLGALPLIEDKCGVSASVFFLGDLVDRGGESCGVMDLVIETLGERPGSRLLIGNHDDWLLRFLEDPRFGEEVAFWLDQGGRETLLSYGCDQRDLAGARRSILADHPAHSELLASAAFLLRTDRYAFVHAGIDPLLPIQRQERDTCLWVRAEFLNHVGPLSHVVVHGHTPQKTKRPTVTENRISMDTGAFFSDVLSAVVIENDGERVTFMATDRYGGVGSVDPVRLDRGFGTCLDRSVGHGRLPRPN